MKPTLTAGQPSRVAGAFGTSGTGTEYILLENETGYFMKPIILGLILLATFSGVARADQEASPRDYLQLSANKKYVLVMLAPIGEGFLEKLLNSGGQDRAIRKKYSSSGVYPNDGNTAPLWTFKVYSFKTFVSANGKYAVFMGPWPRLRNDKDMKPGGEALKQPAVAFVKEGTLIKNYDIKDIVHDPGKLPKSVSHFQWAKKISFDEETARLSIETFDDQNLLFDALTGEKI